MTTDMKEFNEVFKHLSPGQSEEAARLKVFIGRKFKFKIPVGAQEEFLRTNGTIVLGTTWEVVGVQKNFRGELCLRVRCLTYDDQFGRPAYLDTMEFLDLQ